jgi:RNA polymerase-binding transcription factor DksA
LVVSAFAVSRHRNAVSATAAPHGNGHQADSAHLSDTQLRSLRRLLVINRAAHRAEVARQSTTLVAASLGSPAGKAELDRATSARQVYVALEALEEINAALARVEDGSYGACGSCARPIPFERLEVTPQMRFCDACGERGADPSTPPQP